MMSVISGHGFIISAKTLFIIATVKLKVSDFVFKITSLSYSSCCCVLCRNLTACEWIHTVIGAIGVH